MSYRFMRVIVFFDLPMLTAEERRTYVKFRKHLIKSGFIMMQQSVYCKIALNTTAANAIIANVRKAKPDSGLVQLMTITEKQYSRMEFVTGSYTGEIIDNDERFVEL